MGRLTKDPDGRFVGGRKSPNWKGGKKVTDQGYILIYKPEHLNSHHDGYILEHRYIMSEHLGRPLKKYEVVHHKNENKQDNRIENLELLEFGYHTTKHHKGKVVREESRRKNSESQKRKYREEGYVHPLYIDINPQVLINMHNEGKKVKEICKLYHMSKRTYYNKINKYLGAIV